MTELFHDTQPTHDNHSGEYYVGEDYEVRCGFEIDVSKIPVDVGHGRTEARTQATAELIYMSLGVSQLTRAGSVRIFGEAEIQEIEERALEEISE